MSLVTPFTIPLEFKNTPQHLKVYVYNSEDSLRIAVQGRDNFAEDTIAYTDTYTADEQDTLAARMYFVNPVDVGTIAHEATHAALGILNRMGEKSMPITAEAAPQVEEDLAGLVGSLTQCIREDLSHHGVTVLKIAA